MNEPFDIRTHHFACSVGIPYDLARIVTKRIPQEIIISSSENKKRNKNGDRKVFSILMKFYNEKKKHSFNYQPNLSLENKYLYIKELNPQYSFETLSDEKINDLYIRHKISEIVEHFLPNEIDIYELEPSEVITLEQWFF